ncbi:MAG TPA: 50S ribosomal protein L31e [Nitrososphaeraceae archaeon]|nr:50S ribosomal protein L31e [Nitrososphaeraceae archaeon]
MSESEESLTRVYTIRLGKAWGTPQYRRTDRVLNMIKEFAKKHMKTDKIKIEQDLNRYVWRKGKTNPPRTVRVRMIREDDVVIVSSFTEPRIAEETKDQGSEISNGKDPE